MNFIEYLLNYSHLNFSKFEKVNISNPYRLPACLLLKKIKKNSFFCIMSEEICDCGYKFKTNNPGAKQTHLKGAEHKRLLDQKKSKTKYLNYFQSLNLYFFIIF